MAVLKNIITKSGIVINNSYIKVADYMELFTNPETFEKVVRFTIDVWKDEETRRNFPDNKIKTKLENLNYEYSFTYNITSTDNLITQAYCYLKTLPEWQDAVDVI